MERTRILAIGSLPRAEKSFRGAGGLRSAHHLNPADKMLFVRACMRMQQDSGGAPSTCLEEKEE